MSESDSEVRAKKQKQLEELRQRVAQLERELGSEGSQWQATEFYAAYHATTGMILGIAGAMASLLFNVVGSAIVGQSPLRLIQVYLTFPLGERALSDDFSSGVSLAVGCCLYIATGMMLGVVVQIALARFLPKGTTGQRLVLASVLGLLIWGINFYGVLSWLQPMLFGGNWITDPKLLPPWVGAATHLVFAWTMALLYPLGAYVPYQRQTDQVPTVEGS